MPTPAPQDDRVHPPRDHPRWRESYYFSFFDQAAGLGGFSSIGKRPARGHSGSLNVIWGPEHPTLLASEFDTFEHHDDVIEAHGLRYASDEPFGPWQLTFDGRLSNGGDGVECDRAAMGPTDRSSAPKVPVAFDLEFRPDAPPYLYHPRAEWHNLFDGHVDEVGRVTGTVRVGDTTHEIDCRGAKDHSWGVRDWYGVEGWRWMDVVGADRELTLWRATFDGTSWLDDGAVYVGGRTLELEQYEERVETVERPRKPMPKALEVSLTAGGERTEFSGEIIRVVPTLFPSREGGETAWVDQTLVRCSLGGREAWGKIEFEALVRE